MIKAIKAFYARVKAVGRRVQKRVVIVSLHIIYKIGFGMTRLYAKLFHRQLLSGAPNKGWLEVSGYSYSPESAERQS